MFKHLFWLTLACLLFSAIFSAEPKIEDTLTTVDIVKPYRTASVLFSDGSIHSIEMARPMFIANSCQRSTTEASAGEMWVGNDGAIYKYNGNGIWVPRNEEAAPPKEQEEIEVEQGSFDEDRSSILDRVVIEQYSVPTTGYISTNNCTTCNSTYPTTTYYTYTDRPTSYTYSYNQRYTARRALFPRLRNMFSRMRFRFRRW